MTLYIKTTFMFKAYMHVSVYLQMHVYLQYKFHKG